ncbi:7501_t:CDS:2, partial [Racocetra persica]
KLSANNENHNEFNNLKEESSELSQNEANEVASQEVSKDFLLPITSINRNKISKRRLLETLSIPHIAFEQAANIHDKKLDKMKKTIELSQQHNQKFVKTGCTCFINICWPLSAPGLSITKLSLIHYSYTLCLDNVHFINVYRQLPQNIIDKVGFYVKAVSDISQHTLRQLLQGEFKNQLFLDKDLANVIQYFRKGNITDLEKDPENDMSNLLKALRMFKEDNPT